MIAGQIIDGDKCLVVEDAEATHTSANAEHVSTLAVRAKKKKERKKDSYQLEFSVGYINPVMTPLGFGI